jgi:predicted translation initiation factor SUI1
MKFSRQFKNFSDLEQIIEPHTDNAVPSKCEHDGKGNSVHVLLDTKGRKGKSVTIVSGLRHNPGTMEDIARILKQHCGAGGTVKEGKIEIQGDQRTRIAEKLKELNYLVK